MPHQAVRRDDVQSCSLLGTTRCNACNVICVVDATSLTILLSSNKTKKYGLLYMGIDRLSPISARILLSSSEHLRSSITLEARRIGLARALSPEHHPGFAVRNSAGPLEYIEGLHSSEPPSSNPTEAGSRREICSQSFPIAAERPVKRIS